MDNQQPKARDFCPEAPLHNPADGYPSKRHAVPTQRYCQTLDLRDDPQLVAEYRRRHGAEQIWPEIPAGIRAVGILEMEIYILGTRLFMIVETPVDFDWERAMTRLGTLPRQQEWEEYMSLFQLAEPGMSSAEKWRPMEPMFQSNCSYRIRVPTVPRAKGFTCCLPKLRILQR